MIGFDYKQKDLAICKSKATGLTLGKIYKILSSREDYPFIKVCNDNGYDLYYSGYRFELYKKIRIKKLYKRILQI